MSSSNYNHAGYDKDYDSDYNNNHNNDYDNNHDNGHNDNTELKTAKCKVQGCTHEEFSCGISGTTTPLWCHLEGAHWKQYVLTKEIIDNAKLRNIIAIWIINCQRPISIVEDPKLIEIFKYVNSAVQLVKADATKNAIIALYNHGKQELK
ncbi:37575_t:CDS:2, partial [Gigaspora margarita]